MKTESKNFKRNDSSIKDKGQSKIAAADKVTDCQDYQNYNNTGKVIKKHTYLPKNLKNPFAQSQKNIVHRSLKNSFGQNHKKTDNQRNHAALVEIIVENYKQCMIGEKSVASLEAFSNASSDAKKDSTDGSRGSSLTQPIAEKKSPGSRFKYDCIESALDSNSTNNKDSGQRYYNKISIVDSITKFKRPDAAMPHKKTIELTKKFPWGCTCTKIRRKGLEKCKEHEKIESAESFDSYNDAKKKKKLICSPLKKLGRSSTLTVGSDKITLNLPKYSPCASRLAASSKILSSDLTADPDSPLHVPRSRSPSHIDVQAEDNSWMSQSSPKRPSMQASLSLNIQHLQKSRYTPRSRSVGDSYVTSPTSEATTVSYSPTNTEILSLEEVGPHTSSTEGSGSSYSEVKEKLDAEYPDKVRRATLETKC